jgi:hypothetical protein
VGRRVLPGLLVAIAVVADTEGAHALARNALLAALPFAAVAALVTFGDYLDTGDATAGLQALCSGAIVVLLVISCAARNAALHGVPPLGESSLIAVVGLVVLKAALATAPHVGRATGSWPAKP